MQRMLRYVLGGVLLAAVAASTGHAQRNGSARYTNPTDLEAHSRELDQRVIELQHDLMAARHKGDQASVKHAETDLKETQAERVDVLRALGQLR